MTKDRVPVGVDLGLVKLAVLSDETIFDNPHYVKRSAEKIRVLQRTLSRKRPGSNNREKARVKLANAWRKVRNQRMDNAHKISHDLATKYSIIVFEDIHIPKMVKNHNPAKAIMDAAWGQLRTLTAYKAERNGGRVILVNPSGTSQECSRCQTVVPKNLSVRMHLCSKCGLVLDRDVNAAKNVLQRGLEQARAEAQPLLVIPRRRISKFAPLKQEAHGLAAGSSPDAQVVSS
jgi:putative transposase